MRIGRTAGEPAKTFGRMQEFVSSAMCAFDTGTEEFDSRERGNDEMKMIKLVPTLELGNKLNVNVMDFPDAPETDLPAGAGVFPEVEVSETGTQGTAGAFRDLLDNCRKRCGITLEYAPRDVRELAERGMDREAMLAYYRQRIYDLVKMNISQDWACAGGMDEVMEIVGKHI